MTIVKASRVVLILALLGLSAVFLLLNLKYISSEVSVGEYHLGSLPETARYGKFHSLTMPILIAIPGTVVLLIQVVAFALAYSRDKRRWNLDNQLFLWAFIFWSITVVIAFLLSAGRHNSIQVWQVFADESVLLRLPEIFVAGALPDFPSVLRHLASVLFFVAASTSLGMVVLWNLEKLLGSRLETAAMIVVVTAFLLGQGFLSILLVLLSVFGFFSYTTLAVCLLLSLGLGLNRLIVIGGNALGEIKASLGQLRQETRLWKMIITLTVILVGATILQAWARLSFDAASAYFTGAKLTVLTDQFSYTNRSYVAVSGSNAETTLAALILLFGDRSARLISWFQALAFATFCAAIAGQMGAGQRGKVIVVAMVYTTTAFLDLIGDGKTDLFGAAAAMGAVWWLLSVQGANRRLALSICGLLSGFALLYRPTYVFPLLILILAVVIIEEAGNWRLANVRPRVRPLLGSLLLIGIFASLPIMSYAVRNLALFGTLLVPALPAVAVAEPDALSGIADLREWNDGLRTLVRLTYPAFATFVSTPQSLGVLTPLCLAFAPLALVVFSNQRRASAGQATAIRPALAYLVATLLVLWILLTPFVLEIRYVLMLWGLLFVFVGYGVEKAITIGDRSLHRVVVGLLAVLLSAMIVRTIYGVGVTTDDPLEGDAYVCAPLVQCDMLNSINRDADLGDRVLVVAPYSYYLRPDLLACASTAEELAALRDPLAESSESFWTAVYDLGFDYIAYEPFHATTFSPLGDEVELDNPPDWVTLTPVYADEDRTAYAIEISNPSLSTPAVHCQQTDSGRWVIRKTRS